MSIYETIRDIQDQVQKMRESGTEPKQVTLSLNVFEEIAKLIPKPGQGACSFCGANAPLTKGLCWNCYSRYRRNGTPEYQRHRYKSASPSRESQLKHKWENLKHLDFSPLSDREEYYLRLRFEKRMEFQAIADEEGVSKQRVHQVVSTALKRLTPQMPEEGI